MEALDVDGEDEHVLIKQVDLIRQHMPCARPVEHLPSMGLSGDGLDRIAGSEQEVVAHLLCPPLHRRMALRRCHLGVEVRAEHMQLYFRRPVVRQVRIGSLEQ
jgi:hypothetical protein